MPYMLYARASHTRMIQNENDNAIFSPLDSVPRHLMQNYRRWPDFCDYNYYTLGNCNDHNNCDDRDNDCDEISTRLFKR